MRGLLVVLVAVAAVAGCATSHAKQVDWSYAGARGPAAWGALSPAFAACANGRRQSPIDLTDAHPSSLPPLTVASPPSRFTLENNGHTVQATPSAPSTVTLGDTRWTLMQFHAHHPSEHTVGGERFPLELHLVHRNDRGQLLAVGLLVREGETNRPLQAIWSQLPSTKEKVTPPETLEVSTLLPAQRRYFTYEGSLTTPPCTEGVTWVVLVEPVTMSKDQIDAFARLFPDDSRPTQPRNDRSLDESTP